MPPAHGKIYAGISGWRYVPWRGAFYPPGLAQRRELEFASRALPSIEINGSFYGLQTPESYARWRDETPPGFVFSVKGSRYITHIRRLHNVEEPLANFFASGVFNLREKLGPVLWQFPPSFKFDAERVENFFRLLPHSTAEAAKLARQYKTLPRSGTHLDIDEDRALRHCMEIRHASFVNEEFIALLREHAVALVVADTAGKWPYYEDVTAGFVYLRLHGDEELYASGYTDRALDRWAARIRAWSRGGEPADARRISSIPPAPARARDVFCYFDNDIKVKAPFDARRLLEKLGLEKGLTPFSLGPGGKPETARTRWPPSFRPKSGKPGRALRT